MQKVYYLFCLCLITVGFSFGQDKESRRDTLFEKASEGLVRFYFDTHYYLVDKNCSFKSIERLSSFIVTKNAFDGPFKDFNENGTLILTGYYKQGIKEGEFKAYHPNGTIKWQTTFVDNHPSGEWKYYYPDGKPMLSIFFETSGGRILSFWDRLGRQRVVNGKGNYEFRMPFEYYNEYGFPFFERKGKIKNGHPEGYWTTHLVDERNKKVLLSEEMYNNQGALLEGYNLLLDLDYKTPFAIIPTSSFLTAEQLLFKRCSFDDYSGFNTYLANKLNAAFLPSPVYKNSSLTFAYRVSIDKEGNPEMITLSKPLQNQEINKYFEQIIQEIPFYFPSLDDNGEAIEDSLTVSGQLEIGNDGVFNFHSINIERANQSGS